MVPFIFFIHQFLHVLLPTIFDPFIIYMSESNPNWDPDPDCELVTCPGSNLTQSQTQTPAPNTDLNSNLHLHPDQFQDSNPESDPVTQISIQTSGLLFGIFGEFPAM